MSADTLQKPDHRTVKFTPCGKCRGGYITIDPLKNGWTRRPDLDGRDVDGYLTASGLEFFQTKGQPLRMETPCDCMRAAHGYPPLTIRPKVASTPEEDGDIDALGWLRKK